MCANPDNEALSVGYACEMGPPTSTQEDPAATSETEGPYLRNASHCYNVAPQMKNQVKTMKALRPQKNQNESFQKVQPACGSENEKDMGEKMDFG